MAPRTRSVPPANFKSVTPRAAVAATAERTGLAKDPYGQLTVLPSESMQTKRATKVLPLPASLRAVVSRLLSTDDHTVVIARGELTDEQVKSMKSVLRSNRDQFPGFNIRITEGAANGYGPAIRFALYPIKTK